MFFTLYKETNMTEDLCLCCGERPPRWLPDPIPEGTEVMFTEMMAERGLYCQECFDAQEEPSQP